MRSKCCFAPAGSLCCNSKKPLAIERDTGDAALLDLLAVILFEATNLAKTSNRIAMVLDANLSACLNDTSSGVLALMCPQRCRGHRGPGMGQ